MVNRITVSYTHLSLGWEVNDQPIETLSVTLGETLEEPYLSYNDLDVYKRQSLESSRAAASSAALCEGAHSAIRARSGAKIGRAHV